MNNVFLRYLNILFCCKILEEKHRNIYNWNRGPVKINQHSYKIIKETMLLVRDDCCVINNHFY